MHKSWGISAIVLTMVAGGVATTAHATTGELPGGTELTVEIASPVDGATFASDASIDVTGTASVGEGAANKNTDVVFLLDTSGSTIGDTDLDCGTILECERAAVTTVIDGAEEARSPINNVGLAAFPNSSILGLTTPDDPAIATYLGELTPAGATDFSFGIGQAEAVLDGSGVDNQVIVLLTDGAGTSDSDKTIAAVVLAYTIAGAGCTTELQSIVDLGEDLDGLPSSCQVVTNLDELAGAISDTVGSTLESVAVSVDGDAIDAAVTTTPPVPFDGPGSTQFSTTVEGLAPGPHQVCAIATGTDFDGTDSVEDCVSVTVLAPGTVVVECQGGVPCEGSATDPGKSTMTFNAGGDFDEDVTIVPNSGEAGECGGQDCRTGYDVLFPTSDEDGPLATITVTTLNRVSFRDRLNAAVFIDDVRITKQCNNRLLVRLIRTRRGIAEPIPCITIRYVSGGRLEYFVKFNADPGFRFR